MPTKLQIPPRLARYAAGQRSFELPASSIDELVRGLCDMHADLRARLVDDQGKLYSYLAVIFNEKQLSPAELNDLRLSDGDHVEIVTLASGG